MRKLAESCSLKEIFHEFKRRISGALTNTDLQYEFLFFYRLSMEYRVIFRLIYCCGLRISEARTLKHKDVDLKNGRVRILEAKGHKDRFVYLADDLAELLREYMAVMKTVYDYQSGWGFPSRDPTVHCLRHSFVVKRMNLWMEEDVPLKEIIIIIR